MLTRVDTTKSSASLEMAGVNEIGRGCLQRFELLGGGKSSFFKTGISYGSDWLHKNLRIFTQESISDAIRSCVDLVSSVWINSMFRDKRVSGTPPG